MRDEGGVLYVIGTPIGNREDLTPRAARVLSEVRLIVAEDTRRLRGLAPAAGFSARLVSLPAPRENDRVATVLEHLARGESAALVTDAGTPAVSDPGARLVRAAHEHGFRVVPIAGASASSAALSASGISGSSFLFLGFLPVRGADRGRILDEVARSRRTVVLFESPRRLHATLGELVTRCGPARYVAVCRELTKVHEQILAGPCGTLAASLPDPVLGEITVVIEAAHEGASPAPAPPEVQESAEAVLARLLAEGRSTSQAAREAARQLGRDRRELYRIAVELGARRADP